MENHTEERIKMLEQAGTPEEVIRFLSELEAPILYEWSFLCAMEGMSVKELKRIYNAAEKQRAQASELFMRERERFLQAAYENNQGLWKEVQNLLTQVRIMYERASALEEGLNGKLTEAMQTKDKAFGEIELQLLNENETVRELLVIQTQDAADDAVMKFREKLEQELSTMNSISNESYESIITRIAEFRKRAQDISI